MIPSIFNGLALFINMICTWILFAYYSPCLAHCIQFHSWEQCGRYTVDSILNITALYGLSGFLWVSGNYRYHILCNWIIVTVQLIVLTCAYIVYANFLADFNIWQWNLLCCGILFSGFGLVLLYLLESNQWIKKFLKGFTVPDGKV